MNREDTKKAIEVMQAYLDGELIEVNDSRSHLHEWEFVVNPVWDWDRRDYRVKRKPREIWIGYDERGEARKFCHTGSYVGDYVAVKFREVLDD